MAPDMVPELLIGVGAGLAILFFLLAIRSSRRATASAPAGAATKPADDGSGKRDAGEKPEKLKDLSNLDGDEQEGTKVASVPPPNQASTPVHVRYSIGVEPGPTDDEDTGPAPMILVNAVGRTDAGKRRKHNEDAYLAMPDDAIFVIADGMGGYAAGEVASQMAVDVIERAFKTKSMAGEPNRDVPRRADELVRAIRMANTAILEQARSNEAQARMGTTLVSCRFSPSRGRVYVGHVGDSRCYRIRAGKIEQLTTDHTLGAVGITGPSASKLSRAVGIGDEVEVDVTVDGPRIGDRYLLCSDGLSRMVPDDVIRRTVMDAPSLQSAVDRLVEAANEHGGRDNITVILVEVHAPAQVGKDAPAKPAAKPSAAAAKPATPSSAAPRPRPTPQSGPRGKPR